MTTALLYLSGMDLWSGVLTRKSISKLQDGLITDIEMSQRTLNHLAIMQGFDGSTDCPFMILSLDDRYEKELISSCREKDTKGVLKKMRTIRKGLDQDFGFWVIIQEEPVYTSLDPRDWSQEEVNAYWEMRRERDQELEGTLQQRESMKEYECAYFERHMCAIYDTPCDIIRQSRNCPKIIPVHVEVKSGPYETLPPEIMDLMINLGQVIHRCDQCGGKVELLDDFEDIAALLYCVKCGHKMTQEPYYYVYRFFWSNL